MSKKSNQTVKVTLIKSLNGRVKNHQACVETLGLKRIGQTVEVTDDAVTRGKINKVSYLLKVEA